MEKKLCINPTCSNPENSGEEQFCKTCDTGLLIEERYSAIKQLGEGGFGRTYELKGRGDRKVLKVLLNPSDTAVKLFQREAEFLKQNKHPGIPKAGNDAYFTHPRGEKDPQGESDPLHCLVMEKIEGKNLADYVQKKGSPISETTAKEWLEELASILAEVHKQRVIHRDIKPQNIILKPDGKLSLIDFGAVSDGEIGQSGGTQRATVKSGTKKGTQVYSSGYAAQEQINGQALPQSDVYSLGRTFIYLLTGKEPNDRSMYDGYHDRVNWEPHAGEVSDELASLINSMTATKAKDRPADAQELLTRIQAFNKPPEKGEDIEIKLEISAKEAALYPQKTVTFERLVNIGRSFKKEQKSLNVKIPPSPRDGQKLRLKGEGNAGKYGGANGDVYVKLSVTGDVSDTGIGNASDTGGFASNSQNTTSNGVNYETSTSSSVAQPNDTSTSTAKHTTASSTTKPKNEDSSGCLGCIVPLLFLAVIGGGLWAWLSNSSPSPPTTTNPVPTVPRVPPEYPKASCGQGGTSSFVLLRPKDPSAGLNILLNDIKQRFCADAYLYEYEGKTWVRAAAFGSKEGSERFAYFIGQYYNDAETMYVWFE